jgi:hypothetical protein
MIATPGLGQELRHWTVSAHRFDELQPDVATHANKRHPHPLRLVGERQGRFLELKLTRIARYGLFEVTHNDPYMVELVTTQP